VSRKLENYTDHRDPAFDFSKKPGAMLLIGWAPLAHRKAIRESFDCQSPLSHELGRRSVQLACLKSVTNKHSATLNV
jgi:hypothetical protein